MKRFLLASAMAVTIAGTTVAFAAPPAPPVAGIGGDPAPDAPMPPPPPDGPGGRRDRTAGPPPPPSPAAHIRIERGPNVVDVKCADDQPMQVCADIAKGFLDRLPKGPG